MNEPEATPDDSKSHEARTPVKQQRSIAAFIRRTQGEDGDSHRVVNRLFTAGLKCLGRMRTSPLVPNHRPR